MNMAGIAQGSEVHSFNPIYPENGLLAGVFRIKRIYSIRTVTFWLSVQAFGSIIRKQDKTA